MSVKSVLAKIDFSLDKFEINYLKIETAKIVELLKGSISKSKINAEVFVGGSFAKRTITKNENYDIDIFVRFDWKYEDLSFHLEEILKEIKKTERLEFRKMHGSRDYFQIEVDKKITFEIIPVLKIKKAREARNITDLSYFHVRYLKKKLKKGMEKEINLAKKFCGAQEVYGAESYINGFSGYGLECLIIYYKSFEKMLHALAKVKEGERVIIDIEKKYKKKEEVLFELNENKINAPIILVDPTWKERNALAALNFATFKKFQEAARAFLKAPSEKFFEEKKFDENSFRKKAEKMKAEFLHVVLETDRQEGDIAGTKMKKFSNYLLTEMKKYFEVLENEFVYGGGKNAELYLILKSKKEIARIGPPLTMKSDVKRFKATNKDTFVKNGILHARILVAWSAREFLVRFAMKEKKRIESMGISGMRLA